MPVMRGSSSACDVVADPRVFAAFALLNITGLNGERETRYGAVRELVRRRLGGRGEHWRSRLDATQLREFFHKAGGARLMDMLPALGDAAGEVAARGELPRYLVAWQATTGEDIGPAVELLAEFAVEERVDALWNRCIDAYEDERTKTRAHLGSLFEVVEAVARADEHVAITIVPNLLDASGRGYSVSTTSGSWLFAGPVSNAAERERLLIHELLHRWADRAVEETVPADRFFALPIELFARYRMVAEGYPAVGIVIGEIIVRAATEWLHTERLIGDGDRALNELRLQERLGFLGIVDARECLRAVFAEHHETAFQRCAAMLFGRIRTAETASIPHEGVPNGD